MPLYIRESKRSFDVWCGDEVARRDRSPAEDVAEPVTAPGTSRVDRYAGPGHLYQCARVMAYLVLTRE